LWQQLDLKLKGPPWWLLAMRRIRDFVKVAFTSLTARSPGPTGVGMCTDGHERRCMEALTGVASCTCRCGGKNHGIQADLFRRGKR